MGIKDIKAEARNKLALNVHQAIAVYTIEFLVVTAFVALITLACLCINTAGLVAAIIMICYGVVLFLVALVGCGMADFAMVDYYLASYKCKPYNIRRLGETLARGGLINILKLNIIRTLLGFLLTLCLIVPGVIFFVRTSMANHLLIANPKMKAGTALKASNKIMAGRTGEYLALSCSFIGWWFVVILTFGLGFVVVAPYVKLAKTVYYKRKLQGDKAQYVIEPQPVSPQPQAPLENYAEGGFVPAPTGKDKRIKQQQREKGAAPIDTLGDSDVAKMNNAMRDVREVVIPMPSAEPVQDVQAVEVTPVQVVEPAVSVVGESFVETVKPLTTQEVMEADVTSKQFDAMFPDGGKSALYDAVPVEPTSDGAFDDFMSDFSVPTPDTEFKPLTQSSNEIDSAEGEYSSVRTDKTPDERDQRRFSARADDNGVRAARQERFERPSRQERAARSERAAVPERNGAGARGNESAEDRADRLRRERQERIKNLRK